MNGMVYRGEIYYVLPEGNEVGCEQRSGRPGIVVSNNLNNKHAATVEVVRGDFTYSADYTRCGGAETLHFTAPDSLAGLCAATADGGCTLSVGGVTATVPTGGIFAPFALFDAPDGCLTESRAEGGLTVYAGRCGDDVYSIAVDGAGVPVRLSGSVGGSAAEIRVLKFAQISPPAGEEGNAHE